LKRRIGYKISETAWDALQFLKEQAPPKTTETAIVEDAIISAAIAKGWRKPKRKGKKLDDEQLSN